MGLYKDFSDYYDVIFKKDKKVEEFLKSGLKSGDKVLDIACGTGTYSIALGEDGFQVLGIDNDENMIGKCKEKNLLSNVKFRLVSMENLKEINEKFDEVFCIGNSLVHLERKEYILKLVNEVYDILEDGGKFIIGIINYDRIIEKNITSLPPIINIEKGVEFIRNYEMKNEHILFNTILKIKEDENILEFENSHLLLPLKSNEIIDIFKSSKFKKINLYDGFLYENYKKDSYTTVGVAIKS